MARHLLNDHTEEQLKMWYIPITLIKQNAEDGSRPADRTSKFSEIEKEPETRVEKGDKTLAANAAKGSLWSMRATISGPV